MAYKGLRDWMAKLEKMGQLKRITAEVDWDLELSAIAREVLSYRGPALLFENFHQWIGFHGKGRSSIGLA
jgi:4-hydroxy-3-polyprenylbenzoate decarboxylase